MSTTERAQFTLRETEDSLAYQHYLNGLFYRRKGGRDNVLKALAYFKEAVTVSRSFAGAWAMIADAHLFFAGNSLSDPREALDSARDAVETALALDETLAEAHLARGLIGQSKWDWAAARREYERALALKPNLVAAHVKYSRWLSIMGRHDQALGEVRRARQLDPLSVELRSTEAFTLSLAGHGEEAVELYRQVIATEPDDENRRFGFALALSAAGRYEEAIPIYREAMRTGAETTSILCYLGHALARSGRRSEAESILRRLQTTTEYVSPVELAVVDAGLGDTESALKRLQQGYELHDLQMQNLTVDRHFDGVRSDPRFVDLLRRVGLPQ